jgi:PAS domain S-box-containing protein
MGRNRSLQSSELRYRRLFEAARDGILILDVETGKIEDANAFMSELLGYSRDQLLGKELWEIGVFKDIENSQAAFRHLQQSGVIRYEDLPLQTADGALREVADRPGVLERLREEFGAEGRRVSTLQSAHCARVNRPGCLRGRQVPTPFTRVDALLTVHQRVRQSGSLPLLRMPQRASIPLFAAVSAPAETKPAIPQPSVLERLQTT